MKIGVFDSGVGGEYFVHAVQKKFPDAEVLYLNDKEHLPYGNKSSEQLISLVLPKIRQFEAADCDVVLIACNTVTTTIIGELRNSTTMPLVGVEPMIKPAAAITKTGNIAVCATPATLKSNRYAELKRTYAANTSVFEPDCSDWASMIEQNRQNELALEELVADAVFENVDVIVLGCTHYHWIEQKLQELAGNDIAVIQPTEPVLNQLERVLS
jgi:glutamate racemase